jgi:pilus assembly protein TadC
MMRLITLYVKVILALLKLALGVSIILCLILIPTLPELKELVQHLAEALIALLAVNIGHSEYGFYKGQIKIWTEGE